MPKTPGVTASQVYDPERRGVAAFCVVQATGVPHALETHQIDARVGIHKRRGIYPSLQLLHSERRGTVYTVHLLAGSATQRTGSDFEKLVRSALDWSDADDRVKYTEFRGISCAATADHPGSPRAGTKQRKLRDDGIDVHR